MLIEAPVEVWQAISLYLPPKDILSFLSIHSNVNNALSPSPSFWSQLLLRDRDHHETSDESTTTNLHQEFMLHSHIANLSSIKWLPISQEQQSQFPIKAREGHNSCILNGPEGFKTLVITGGFSDDQGVTVMEIPKGLEAHTSNWGWTRLEPRYCEKPTFVYGASLTALPVAVTEEMEKNRFMAVHPGIIRRNVAKAVRFGGFEGGGYSGETNEVWVLTVVKFDYDDGSLDQFAVWEKIETHGRSPRARAYHSATLIHDRYLVIIGGMTHSGSCMDECVLDIKTWTWIDMRLGCRGEPSGRHGHSVVWDTRRDRLVMFGGGDGTDLLRSGNDNNEVWELKMNGIKVPGSDVISDSNETMWEWSKIHKNTLSQANNSMRSDNGSDYSDESEQGTNDADIDLSLSESLCLGRCHNAMKISPNAVLLMFGGGRPSTNGVIGYNLSNDTFIRPNVLGPLPAPRFTGVASLLEAEGYVLVHGGFNDNIGGTVLGMNVLDLAPCLRRNYRGFDLDEDRESHDVVSDEAARNGQYGANSMEMSAFPRLLLAQYMESQMGGR